MKKRSNQEVLRSFDELGDFMKKNGSNVLEHNGEAEDNSDKNQTYLAFGSELNQNNDEVKYSETKESYNAFEEEKQLLANIEEAQNTLNEINSIPGALSNEGENIEPDAEISEVVDNNQEDDGIVSEQDKDIRLAQAKEVAEEIEQIDEGVEKIMENNTESKSLEKATNIRLRLSEETKNIIRETSPELFNLINEKDIGIISSFESKLDSIKGKKKIGEKIRELLKKKIITNNEVDNFNSAKQRRDTFMDKAKELNVPLDVAKIIYKANPAEMNEVRGIEKEKIEDTQIINENISIEKEDEVEVEYENSIKGDLHKKADYFGRLISSINNEDEKVRLQNALKSFIDDVNNITSTESLDNNDLIANTEDYADRMEKNIKDILNANSLPKEKAEEVVVGEEFDNMPIPTPEEKIEEVANIIVEEIAEENIEKSKEKEKSPFEIKIEKLHAETNRCREIVHTVDNKENREKLLTMIKTFEDNSRMFLNNPHLSDDEKLNSVNGSINRLISGIDEIYNDLSEDDSEKTSDIKGFEDSAVERPNRAEKNTPEYVLEKYEKFGIGPDALKEIEGFSDLSDGQKLLMLKNYESAVLGKIKIEGKSEADKEWNKNTTVGKLGRIGLSIITLGTAKTFREKRKQKEIATKVLHGDYLGFENRQAMLKALVDVAAESPDVYFDKNGELSIDYIPVNKYADNPYSREIIQNYNKAASDYSRIPYSWFDNTNKFNGEDEKVGSYSSKLLGLKFGTLSGKERTKLSDLREEYNIAREEYLNLAIEESGDGEEIRRQTLKDINSLDERVKMNQLFVSDPNAEQMLQDITDTNVFNQTISEFYSKKGKYMAYGSLLRMSAAATVSSIAAPAALLVFGGMSYFRGKREARDLLKLKRTSGIVTENDIKEEVVYDVNLEKSLSDLKILLNNAKEKKDAKSIYHIEARINEVSDKLKSGYKIERKTRKLGEFRDAKFFSNRIEQLVSKYELLKDGEGQKNEAALIEVKIAQTATLMRELMNNNLLTFGKGEVASTLDDKKAKNDARSITNRLDFIQALSLADATISLDDESIKRKMASVVNLRREKIDEISNKKALNHIVKAVTTSVAFAGAGYALTHIGSEFFGDNTSESISLGMYKVRSGEGLESILKDNVDGLNELSSHAQSNVISNFINRLNTEQLNEIGITNPHKLTPGQNINVEKLEEYFNATRINGRTLIENAEMITGKTAKGSSISRLIDDMVDTYKENLREPEDTIHHVDTHHEEIANVAGSSHLKHFEDVNQVESEWSNLSTPEKLEAIDVLVPSYIKNQLGEQNADIFIETSKNMPASSLLLGGSGLDNAKGKMLEELEGVLRSKGITPDDGYAYQGNLYDYVMKSYRLKIMRSGLNSVK